MFKQLEVNTSCLISVVFKSATPRKTRAGKDYLTLEMFDGETTVVGNYWDWSGKAIPKCAEQVFNVSGNVSEYQGQKQVNITGIVADKNIPLTDFLPSSGKDITAVYNEAIQFITHNVQDDILRDLVINTLEDYSELWLRTPAAVSVHHAYVAGTLIHSLSVARIAASIASQIPEANFDITVVGAMLHDVGKLEAYTFEGSVPAMTDAGKLFEHSYIGANMLTKLFFDYATPKTQDDLLKLDILKHIILSHHGSQEFGAVVIPQTIEAHIVHHADAIDATREMIVDASNKTEGFWTDKIWGLNNRPVVNYKTIKNLSVTTYDDEFLTEIDPDGAVTDQ
jgi:3'-5' exoribonuclease